MEKFEKIVEFTAAWDKRTNNIKTNSGISPVEIYFVLKGPKGAVHFSVMTDWFLPQNMEQKIGLLTILKDRLSSPMGMTVGYHSPKKFYETQKRKPCSWFGGKLCYCDSSSLLADDWVKNYLLPGGSDEVWKQLKKEYYRRFGRR